MLSLKNFCINGCDFDNIAKLGNITNARILLILTFILLQMVLYKHTYMHAYTYIHTWLFKQKDGKWRERMFSQTAVSVVI